MAQPTGSFLSNTVVRMIGDHKWYNGVLVLQANPDQKECWVAEHYSGYKYILERGSEPGTYLQKTYCGDTLMRISTMEVPHSSLNPVVDDPDPVVDNDNAGKLLNPDEARKAFENVCKKN